MSLNDLHTTTDPMVWAIEFVKIVRENKIDVTGEDAEGFMVAWFSNLLGAERDAVAFANLTEQEKTASKRKYRWIEA